MNKQNMRAFSFGIFFTVCFLGIFYFWQDTDKSKNSTIEDSKTLLEHNNFVVLTKNEYIELQKIDLNQTQQTLPDVNNNTEEIQKEENQPKEENTEETSIIHYRLEVKSGMTSSEIAKLLVENQIIQTDVDFDRYLQENNLQTKIQIGSYSLTNQMSNMQIAKMITNS